MIARIYNSTQTILKFAIEDIFRQFKKDFFIDDYDFLIFGINSDYPYRDVNSTIKKILKTDKFIAFNAIDLFANADTLEGIVALFIKFERDGAIDTYYQDNFVSIKNCVNYLKSHKDALNIIISGVSNQVPTFLDRINKKIIDDDIFLIGGLSSGYLDREELVTYQYVDDKIIKNGFVIISFKNVEFQKGISLGYKPIGPIYNVNLSKDNRLYVAEYQDASLIAKNLLNGMDSQDITNLWYSPVVILDDKDGEVDVVRTFKSFKEGEYVEFFGPIPNTSKVKLSFATEDMLIESDKKEAIKIKNKLNEIELGLNFSCIARQFALGDKQNEETKLYSEIFNAPMFGFFTFGEIGMNKTFETFKFYNQTSLICGIKEK